MSTSPELQPLTLALTGARTLPAASQGVALLGGRGDALEDAGLLEENLRRLEEATGLAPLPPAVAAEPAREEYELRVRAVRMRLSHLGYEAGDRDSGRLDVPLLKALHAFREEAGLPRNVGIDAPTWDALQELVALEPPFHVGRWLTPSGLMNPVLLRAVQLRLTVLGLRENKPVDGKPGEYTEIPLKRFRAVLNMLQLEPTATLSVRQTVALLFDHDRQVEAVARGGPEVRQALAGGLPLKEPASLSASSRYLLRLARAELWLNGYPVGDIRAPLQEKAMQASLRVHWQNVAEAASADAVQRHSDRLDLETFEDFARQQRAPEVTPEELAAFVRQNEPELQDYWARDVPNSTFSLWDGLRRAVKWLGRQVKQFSTTLVDAVRRGLEYAVTLVKNVFRALFRSVNEVLTGIRKAAAAFVDGVGVYLKGEVHEGTPDLSAACRLRLDGDVELVVLGDGGIEAAKALLVRLDRVGKAIQVAGSILSFVIGLIGAVVKGVFGWISLIALLVRQGPELLERVSALAALA